MSLTSTELPAQSSLLVSDRDQVRVLTLNRPERRNALNPALVERLHDELTRAEDDAKVRALVLAGAGESFCAGADLRHLVQVSDRGESPIPFLSRVSEVVTRLERSRLVVVAAIHGHAVAGGLELALGCDVVVAADDAQIGDGHVRNHLLPGGGASVRLPYRLGPQLARWLILSGELIPASDARLSAWTHQVVPRSELMTTALKTAAELASTAGATQQRAKELLASLLDRGATDGLQHELEVFDRHWRNHDVGAAVKLFLDRPRSAE